MKSSRLTPDARPAPPRLNHTFAVPSVNVVLQMAHHDTAAAMKGTEEGKESKGQSNYRQAYGSDACENCTHGHFAPGDNQGTCDVVAGPVRKRMVSDLYESPTQDDTTPPTTG